MPARPLPCNGVNWIAHSQDYVRRLCLLPPGWGPFLFCHSAFLYSITLAEGQDWTFARGSHSKTPAISTAFHSESCFVKVHVFTGWSALDAGKKRWALYPPWRIPPGVTFHVDDDGDVNIESPSPLDWFLDVSCSATLPAISCCVAG